ncbi:MAG TPA: hypothetical protein ACHBX0_07150 [Arsenophonus sp.]
MAWLFGIKSLAKDTQLPLWQQAAELFSLLDAIYCDQSILHHLSDHSRCLLRHCFLVGANEINEDAILTLLANYSQYLRLQVSLGNLIGHSFKSGLAGLSLQLALEKSDYWHKRLLINLAQLK